MTRFRAARRAGDQPRPAPWVEAAGARTVPPPLATRHGVLHFDRRTAVVGILNVTPDSFYNGGRYVTPEVAVARGLSLVAEGADIIDIGGESTRPGAAPVEPAEELRRVIPVIRGLREQWSGPISIDTYKAEVAAAALEAGADIVNDVTAGRGDPEMLSVVSAAGVAIVLMHMRGTPADMQRNPVYVDVVSEVEKFLRMRLEAAMRAGIAPERILIDPGIGFGKTADHNLTLLRHLEVFTSIGSACLVGTSRKSFIGQVLGVDAEHRLEGTEATVALAVAKGVHAVRVHDVGAAVRVVRVAEAVCRGRVGECE